MQKLILCSALLGVLLSPTISHGNDFSMRPPEMVGSRSKQQLQNDIAKKAGVRLLLTDEDILEEILYGNLVRIPLSEWYYTDPDLGLGYPDRELMYYVRPWVVEILLDPLGERYFEKFGRRLKVTSLVRTSARQGQLRGWNVNAQASVVSAHLYGSVVDISKLEMSDKELRWMRRELNELIGKGRVVVVEEMNILNFHIFVIPPAGWNFHPVPPADHTCTFR